MQTFWKIFTPLFGAICLLTLGSVISAPNKLNLASTIGIVLSWLEFAALCGLTYERRLLNRLFWSVLFWVTLLGVCVATLIFALAIGTSGTGLQAIPFVPIGIPACYGVFLYAFRRPNLWHAG